jgi:hypothetical protein
MAVLKKREIALCEAVDRILVNVGNHHIEDHEVHVGAKSGG